MIPTLHELLARVELDPWRGVEPFTSDLAEAHQQMLKARGARQDIQCVLSSWLQQHQPCLFGRLAAKQGFLSYCIITEEDVAAGDEAVRDRIQDARLNWTRDAYEGRKSGFVILLVSDVLARAVPNATIRDIALRLTSLYLLRDDVRPDVIYHDDIWLEKPGNRRTTWTWRVGANYFAAQGDGRWWHDHRVPGGVALSMNSVGHFVKSARLASAMRQLDDLVGGPPEELTLGKVDSLPKALEWAMRTIHGAADTVSGRATALEELDEAARKSLPACPIQLPQFLRDRNYCEYRSYYHTDHTVPSEYFEVSVTRPANIQPMSLDLTYLFHESASNPDHISMGVGRRVRSKKHMRAGDSVRASERQLRAKPRSVVVKRTPRLEAALRGSRPDSEHTADNE